MSTENEVVVAAPEFFEGADVGVAGIVSTARPEVLGSEYEPWPCSFVAATLTMIKSP